MKNIEQQLKAAITCSGTPILQIARQANIPPSKLYDFRNGRASLALVNVQRLCDFFGFELHARGDGCASSSQ